MTNPYAGRDDGRVSFSIKEQLKKVDVTEALLKKRFYDISFNLVM